MKKIISVFVACVIFMSSFAIIASADVGDYKMNEVEYNDTYSSADRIYNDYTVSGTLTSEDVDYFKFVLPYDAKISFLCVADYSPLRVALKDSNDEIIGLAVEGYTDSGTPKDAIIYTLSAGTYYLMLINMETGYSNTYMFYFEYIQDSSHTHSYSASVTNPTCTEQGYTTYTCSCGATYTSDYTNPKGHRESQWITSIEASCTETGVENKYCLDCGEELDSRTIPFSHSFEWVVTKPATETETGEKHQACMSCGEISETVIIPIIGWYEDKAGMKYVSESGDFVCDSWVVIDGKTYYFDKAGLLCTNAFVEKDNNTVYVNENGEIVYDKWVKHNNGWYYLNANGNLVKNTWQKDSHGWCYVGNDGRMLTNAWIEDSKGWCYVGSSGYCVTNNWVQDNGYWYYLDGNGRMVTNQWMKDSRGWCYLSSNGKMATNAWVKDSKGWCYVGSNGYCVTNQWMKDSYGWCYLGADGRMVTNQWIKDSQGWCYVGSNGYCVKNQWMKDSKGWCYLDGNGRMLKNGWAKDSKGWCYLGSNGYITTGWVFSNGYWYYMDSSGHMVTGWREISSKWYYFDTSGKMATNTYIGNNWVGSDGAWIKNFNPYDREYNTLVYSDSKVDIYFKKITQEALVFQVRNKTGVEITIQADALAINGRSTNKITMSDDVAPYSTGLVYARCNIPGVGMAGTISGQFRIIDFNRSFDSYNAKFVNVVVDSSIDATKPSVNLPLVYSDSRVKIYYKETTSSGVVFTVENLTNTVVTIQANSVSVNGVSTDRITMSDDVAPKSIGDVTARCSPAATGSSVYKIGASLRVIDFNRSFNSYDATFYNIYV